MDFFGSYKSPFGYKSGENGRIDSYGVDHSGFSTQDELQYQTAHANRMGWQGAKKGLPLQQACPTNPKAYVNPDDYDDIF